MHKKNIFFLLSLLSTCLYCFNLFAQVDPPDEENLFRSDSKKSLEAQDKKRDKYLKTEETPDRNLDMQSGNLQYETKEGKTIVTAPDGLVASKGGLKLSADRAVVNLSDKNAELDGDVYFGWNTGSLRADKAAVDFENETGTFSDAVLNSDVSDFYVTADKVDKLSEFDYQLVNPHMSSCRCPDGSRPWEVSCSDAILRDEGYGKAHDATLKLGGVPIFYTPYLVFPFKRERQSGFLVPTFGYSDIDGAKFSIPYFWEVDESTDLIFRPFTETNTRTGMALDYNEIYSSKSELESRFYFSNESARDGDNRGTITSDLYDPTIDENRYAGYLTQQWRNESDAFMPVSLISDIHYVSDDLFLREFDDEDLGEYNARYATSRMAAYTSAGPLLSAQLSGEFNQSILTDDDLVFQRLPELNLYSQKSVRPFGFNPLGFKMDFSNNFQAVNFNRKEGFDGWRYNLNPGVSMPLRYKNYVTSELKLETFNTFYNLGDSTVPDNSYDIEDDKRNIYRVNYTLRTEMEKVSDVTENSWLTWLTSLGKENKNAGLTRIKQSIEPVVSFNYVPDEYQDDLPFFDSMDRMRERQTAYYGFTHTLYGRFMPENPANQDLLELSPNVEDLPSVSPLAPFSDPAQQVSDQNLVKSGRISKGQTRELARFGVYQTFDYLEDKKDLQEDQDPWSDLTLNAEMYPSNYFALKFDGDLDSEKQDFSAWGIGTHFRDDRGDALRLRYSFIDNDTDQTDQIEGNLELAFSDRLKLGYYARYDNTEGEFIDNQLAFRIGSSCNCWDLDIGYRERLNPDKEDFILQLNLRGLGNLNQDISFLEKNTNSDTTN